MQRRKGKKTGTKGSQFLKYLTETKERFNEIFDDGVSAKAMWSR